MQARSIVGGRGRVTELFRSAIELSRILAKLRPFVSHSSLSTPQGFTEMCLSNSRFFALHFDYKTTHLKLFYLLKAAFKRFIFQRTNMAKWGEGDPRWIVEERADATNVNNWHWYVLYRFFHFMCSFATGLKRMPRHGP